MIGLPVVEVVGFQGQIVSTARFEIEIVSVCSASNVAGGIHGSAKR